MRIEDRVAVVTGGASGLGEATARALMEKGANVALLDFDQEKGEQLASELGDKAIFCKTDVTDESSVQSAIEATMQAFESIDVLVCCAGTGSPMKILDKKGKAVSIEKFNRVVQVNLIGTVNVLKQAAEKMIGNTPDGEGEKGVIINTASVAAYEGQIGQAAYSASKAAVVGMTLPLAREFADHGIRVNTIVPGLFLTPMLEVLPDAAKQALAQMMPFPKRLGKPSEFALLANHIIQNPMLNGECIRLDAALRLAAK